MKIDLLGVSFDNVTLEEAVEIAVKGIHSGGKSYIVTPNPEIVWMTKSDPSLKNVIAGAALTLPDGVGITIGASILGTPLKARVPGIDFTERLLYTISRFGGSVFLLGSKPGVAEKAGIALAEKYPGLVIAGCHDGYFTDDAAVIGLINSAAPHVTLVCLGAPKQELWMASNLEKLNTGLCIGLGGVLDAFAGNVKRAPPFMRKFGLEWLYRLISQPRRITRMAKIPMFIFNIIWLRIRGDR